MKKKGTPSTPQETLAYDLYSAMKKFLDSQKIPNHGYPRQAVMTVLGEMENQKMWLYYNLAKPESAKDAV